MFRFQQRFQQLFSAFDEVFEVKIYEFIGCYRIRTRYFHSIQFANRMSR